MPIVDHLSWKQFIETNPSSHALQSFSWGALKKDFGWESVHFISGKSGAQILLKSLPLGYTLAYIPKGPIGKDWSILFTEIDAFCKENNCVFLKIEPDSWEDEFHIGLIGLGFRPSPHVIQPSRTILLDISGSEDDILGRMKQKTRYNTRLAIKKEVVVSISDNIAEFSSMMDITAQRDAFGVHTQAYYQKAYDLFYPDGKCALLVAKYQDQPLAGLMVFTSGNRAWYLYGSSTNQHRNRMPTYLLQWEAIRWAREKGCTTYDLWGVPDEDEEFLEANFSKRNEGLWGVYRFKRGFGGEIRRTIGAFDKVYNPIMYFIYQFIVSRRNLA